MSDSLQTGIGIFYFLAALMNVGFALHYQKVAKDMLQAIIWYVVAGAFALLGVLYMAHHGPSIFPWLRCRTLR